MGRAAAALSHGVANWRTDLRTDGSPLESLATTPQPHRGGRQALAARLSSGARGYGRLCTMNANRPTYPSYGSPGLGQPFNLQFQTAILADWVVPARLFRRFDRPEHADALAKGVIWISTLNHCRQNAFDRLEGTRTYHTGVLTSHDDGENGRLAWAAELMGFRGVDSSRDAHVRIADCTIVEAIPDAHVLCMSQHASREAAEEQLGPGYYVEIDDPETFVNMVTAAYFRRLYSPGDRLPMTYFGSVRYAHREFFGRQAAPGPVGFVNPVDFEAENEVRVLWTPKGSTENLTSLLLPVPEVAHLCRRVG